MKIYVKIAIIVAVFIN